MKKIAIFTLVLIASLASFGQKNLPGSVSLRPELGVSFGNLSGKNVSINDVGEFTPKFGFIMGAEVDYQVNEKINLSAGMLYTSTGTYVKSGYLIKDDPSSFRSLKDFSLSYISIPLIANFYVLDKLALKVGLQPSFLLDAKGSEIVAKELPYNVVNYKKSDFSNYDFVIPVGLSYEFNNVVLDARYNIGTSKIFKKSSLAKHHNSYFSFTVGYRFSL